ncbi:MAG: N,N-dimethylformamidase beta subunit family domain-containing protein [Candidatus Latescibacterota bacterium]
MTQNAFYIEGYAGQISYVAGQELTFHVSATASQFRLRCERVGKTRVEVLCVEDIPCQHHPVPDNASSHGCGWPSAFSVPIPEEWSSGYYEFTMEIADDGGTYEQRCVRSAQATGYFVLRPKVDQPRAKILLGLSTNTYAAYNNWGGFSLYAYHGRGGVQGNRVSFQRPDRGLFSRWEAPFVQWIEENGYALDYCTNLDLEHHPDLLGQYPLLVSVGHDEYWSAPMRDRVEAFIGRGGNCAFFSGNSVCWQVRSEDDGEALTCWKQRFNQDPAFRGDHSVLSTLWSHHLVKRPENELTGVGFLHGGYHLSHGQLMDGSGAYTVHRPDEWVFAHTGLAEGDEFGGADTIVGYECDGCEFTLVEGKPQPTGRDGTPEDFTILGTAPAQWHPDDSEWYDAWQPGHRGHAVMGYYQRGGTVFTAGTTDWSHGLAGGDSAVEQITRNVIDRLTV